ncbi:MAG: hypothetical protein ABIM32_06125 [candidate division WOR-3 bacterium]
MVMKYVMFDFVYPVIFSICMPHNQVSYKGLKPTSAGFVKFIWDDEKQEVDVICYGESISLELKSLGCIDADIIKTFVSSEV